MIKEINYINKNELEEIYIHDIFFKEINIDYNNKVLDIMVLEDDTKRCYKLIFENVVRFDLFKLSLWGKTNNQILDMYLDDFDIMQYINQKCNKNQIKNVIQNVDKLFSIEILIDNGDKIGITCNKITFIN